jgi:hypothetical protein
MSKCDSYAYFALRGDFNPAEVTVRLGIEPTRTWEKDDKSKFKAHRESAFWAWETVRGKEIIFVENLVEEVVAKLESKAQVIVELKRQLQAESTLQVVLYIDMNEKKSTPALGHEVRTINFLYATQTSTDVDIYRYDSCDEE